MLLHFDNTTETNITIRLGLIETPVGRLTKIANEHFMFFPANYTSWGASMLREVAKKLDDVNSSFIKSMPT